MKLTPLKIEMILAIHYVPSFTEQFPNLYYPAQREALKEFEKNDLISSADGIKLSPKGKQLVEKLLAVTI